MKTTELKAAIAKLAGGDRVVVTGGRSGSQGVAIFKGDDRVRRWHGGWGSPRALLERIHEMLQAEQPHPTTRRWELLDRERVRLKVPVPPAVLRRRDPDELNAFISPHRKAVKKGEGRRHCGTCHGSADRCRCPCAVCRRGVPAETQLVFNELMPVFGFDVPRDQVKPGER